MSRVPLLLDYLDSLGHKVFASDLYDLNIIGIRSDPDHSTINTFDDRICCIYRDEDDQWITRTWPATTDPGLRYLGDRPLNPKGCAAMAEGQYRGAYKIGLHRGLYTALVQTAGKVSYYRDNNRDSVLDLNPEEIHEGYIGLNIHRAAKGESEEVGPFSAGCQVFKRSADLEQLIALCHKQIKYHPTWKTFTYTLVNEPMM